MTLTSLSIAAPLVIASCLLAPFAAYAQTSSIEIASDEVFLDTTTGKLSTRMRMGYEPTDINKIAIVAPETAHVTVSYWTPGDDASCPTLAHGVEPPEGAEERSGAPTGPVVPINEVRMQKFVAKVGPLTTGREYCLAYSIRAIKPLSKEDAKQIDDRLNNTITRLTVALARSPEEAEIVFRGRLAGSPSAEDQSVACAQILREYQGVINARDFATLFSCELGWPLNQLVILDPTTERWVPIRRAVESYISGDSRLREALEKALLDNSNQQSAHEEIVAALQRGLLPEGRAQLDQDVLYDPLLDIDSSKLIAAILKEPLKKPLQEVALANDREAFIRKVWALRTELTDKQNRKRLEGALEGRLEAFLTAAIESRPIKLSRDELRAATARLNAALSTPVLPVEALKYAPQVPSSEELRKYPATDTDPGKFLREVSRVRENLTRDFELLLRAGEATKTAVIQSDGYKAFRERIRMLIDSSGSSGFVVNPTFKERFPFWVTGDVGVSLTFLGKKEQPTETGASLYFGLNFYLAEMDKSEPLLIDQWDWHDFKRRFALNAGITLTHPSGVEGIEGVIGTKMLMTGAGLRFTDYLRVSGGILYYLQKDPSPLSDDKTIKLAPYVSASLDVDVVGTINNWFSTAKSVAP